MPDMYPASKETTEQTSYMPCLWEVGKMKERPIIFNTENVKAILDGRKTQTRRVVKPCSKATLHDGSQPEWVFTLAKCPFGQVGDRLWVRETWRILDDTMLLDDLVRVEYQADGQIIKRRYGDIAWNEGGIDLPVIASAMKDSRVKPSHHLPHIISRITLEITGVRVERLQEITEEDVRAEGIRCYDDVLHLPPTVSIASYITAEFVSLWDSLNAKRGYGWETNPWVWVLDFKHYNRNLGR